MKRNIIATAEAGHKLLTDRIDLSVEQLDTLIITATQGEGLNRFMTQAEVADVCYRLCALCFDAGLCVGHRLKRK